jgi:hypothetical protein
MSALAPEMIPIRGRIRPLGTGSHGHPEVAYTPADRTTTQRAGTVDDDAQEWLPRRRRALKPHMGL